MRVTCPNCDRPYAERNFVPGAARRCPLCDEIIFLPMEPVPEAYLVPLEGQSCGERIALAARMTIGRAHECDIRVLDGTLSRQHAEICLADGAFVISDLGSRNKVMINGVTTAEGPLVHGDIIRLGNRSYRFEMPGRTAKPAAWTPEVRTRLGGGEEEPSETSSTVRTSTSESARLLAALNKHAPRKAAAELGRVERNDGSTLDPIARPVDPVTRTAVPASNTTRVTTAPEHPEMSMRVTRPVEILAPVDPITRVAASSGGPMEAGRPDAAPAEASGAPFDARSFEPDFIDIETPSPDPYETDEDDDDDRAGFDTANRSYDGWNDEGVGVATVREGSGGVQGSSALAPVPMPFPMPESHKPQPIPIRLLPDPEPDHEPETVRPEPPLAVPHPDPTRTYATLLCAELYGISELATSPEPRRAIDAINRYLAILVDAAHRHGAFVDSVNGELVQAFWVAPTANPEGPQRAVECALEIHTALNNLNATLASEGLPPVQVAIAIHSGEAVAGELGAGAHREFAVVGETVHLAGRLRSCARPGEILMTEASYGLIEGVAKTLLMPYMELPGFSGHGHIYAVQGLQRC